MLHALKHLRSLASGGSAEASGEPDESPVEPTSGCKERVDLQKKTHILILLDLNGSFLAIKHSKILCFLCFLSLYETTALQYKDLTQLRLFKESLNGCLGTRGLGVRACEGRSKHWWQRGCWKGDSPSWGASKTLPYPKNLGPAPEVASFGAPGPPKRASSSSLSTFCSLAQCVPGSLLSRRNMKSP